MTWVPFPDDAYVMLVGRLAYAVTYLEGTLLFDLPRHAAVLPPELSVAALERKTAGQIARQVAARADDATDPDVARFLAAAAAALRTAAERRNSVLHARPATIDGQQTLHRQVRATPSRPPEEFAITRDWLTAAVDEVDALCADVAAQRVW